MIVLVGFMGAGKTTIGRRLAQRLGVPFLDSDLVIEQRQGRCIPDIFSTDGELAFRDIEEQTIAALLRDQDGVLSLGGGAVERPATQKRLAGHTVILLDVTLDTAMARAGDVSKRPMLRRDVSTLYERRAGAYRSVASVIALTDGRTVDQIVGDLISRLTRSRLPVDPDRGAEDVVVRSGGRQYPILVGSGLLDTLGDSLPSLTGARRAFLVCQAPEPGGVDGRVLAGRAAAGLQDVECHILASPSGPIRERGDALVGRITAAGAGPGDLLLAVGGLEVCDVTALVSTGLPRPRLVFVPTTLVAQADSSAGGFRVEDVETRSVRAVHQPEAVVCDLSLGLWSAGDEGWLDGLAELTKQAFLLGPGMLDPFLGRLQQLADRDMIATARTLRRGHNLKAAQNAARELWQEERTLSYGRPFMNAITRTVGPQPGQLSLGLLAAAHVSQQQGRLTRDDVEFQRGVLQRLGLPTRCEALEPEAAAEALQLASARSGPFVLLEALGRPVTDGTATQAELISAFARLRR